MGTSVAVRGTMPNDLLRIRVGSLLSSIAGAVVVTLTVVACSSSTSAPQNGSPLASPSLASITSAVTATQDWSQLGGGQCLVSMQSFYRDMFGARVPIARSSWNGACASEGACHIWLDDIPSAAEWERVPNDGAHRPSPYDLVVYPPHGSNPYGHIAAVDHVDGSGTIYVMDSNWNGDEQRSWSPHTTPGYVAYGWYHLRALPGGGGVDPNDPRTCGNIASASGFGNAACEQNGNRACRGAGVKSIDCDHCCDTSSLPPPSFGGSCGDLAGALAFVNAQCETNGNGACKGSGTTTSDCAQCCDAVSDPPETTALTCGQLQRHYAWAQAACEWNGNGACSGEGTTTSDCAHCCER